MMMMMNRLKVRFPVTSLPTTKEFREGVSKIMDLSYVFSPFFFFFFFYSWWLQWLPIMMMMMTMIIMMDRPQNFILVWRMEKPIRMLPAPFLHQCESTLPCENTDHTENQRVLVEIFLNCNISQPIDQVYSSFSSYSFSPSSSSSPSPSSSSAFITILLLLLLLLLIIIILSDQFLIHSFISEAQCLLDRATWK